MSISDGSGVRLGVFLPSLDGGGAERVMLSLVRAFAERGFTIDLILAMRTGAYIDEIPSGVNVVDLRSTGVLRAVPGLALYLRRHRPSALLSTLTHANVAAVMAGLIARRGTRVVVREANDVVLFRMGARSLRRRALPRFMRIFYSKAAAVIGVSSGVAASLSRLLGNAADRVEVIANPVDTGRIRELAAHPTDNPWLDAGGVPVVLAAGRLTEQKDFSSLLRAFALAHQCRPLRLVILGDGEQRPELEHLAAELGIASHVQLPGFVKNPFAFMARASVFVLSSRWEGLPNTLLEALATGCRIVSTDCPSGPSEILEDGKYGMLTPPGDVERLAGAILDSLNRDVDRPALMARAEAYQPESIVDRYLAVLLDRTFARQS